MPDNRKSIFLRVYCTIMMVPYFCRAMKKYAWPCALFLLLSAACKQPKNSNGTNNYVAPKPGTVVAADSAKTLNDRLNEFRYVVTVTADSAVKYGVYNVIAEDGPNIANGQFTMPHGAEHAVPLIRKGNDAATFVIGFHDGEDTTFYDYYEVKFVTAVGENLTHTIAMKYLKSYSFK